MKCRLKSSNASRGVDPSPLAPVRTFDPIKASQMSSTNPIRGRSRAAGLSGCVSRKSSTSSLMRGGSSWIGNEVITWETCIDRILDLGAPKEFTHNTVKAMRGRIAWGRDTALRRPDGAARRPYQYDCVINRGPRPWPLKSSGCRPC